MKYFKHIFIVLAIITIAAVAYKDSREVMLEKQKEQANKMANMTKKEKGKKD